MKTLIFLAFLVSPPVSETIVMHQVEQDGLKVSVEVVHGPHMFLTLRESDGYLLDSKWLGLTGIESRDRVALFPLEGLVYLAHIYEDQETERDALVITSYDVRTAAFQEADIYVRTSCLSEGDNTVVRVPSDDDTVKLWLPERSITIRPEGAERCLTY